ncbi:MAG: hypothetical protein HY342_12435 [Candidatus Lambdaproteobacteria bacterium]|nr:hypothetical protein [Candidatus Lambdaproteobacteria bacterium]
MARAAYVISLHPGRVEGIGIDGADVQANTAVVHTAMTNGEGPAQLERALEGFFRAAHWEPRPAVLVLNTEDVRFRKIDFPFSNAKKIRQALAFELEHVLLEPLEAMVYDFRIIPHEDGSAEALVYLVPREDVERILAVCAQHRINPWRITFSAQALSQGLEDTAPAGFLVYVGEDEIFVADVAGRELHAVKSIPLTQPQDAPPGGATPDAAAPEAGADASHAPAAGLQPTQLQQASEEINRFIRTHGLGRSAAAVTLKGRLAPWFRWQPDAGAFTLQAPPNGRSPHPAEGLTGVLAELQANPRTLLASRGINFSRRRGAWLAQLKEVRGPAIALAALLVLTLALGTFNFVVSLRGDRALARRLNTQVATIVRQYAPRAASPDAGLREMQANARQLQQKKTLTEEFSTYHYNVLTLLRNLSAIYKEFPQLSLESLKYEKDRITLAGATDSYQAAETLKNRLENMPQFTGRTITVSNQRSGQTITYRINVER